MKLITIRVVIALCTFIIGIIFVAVWLVNPAPNVSDIPPIEVKVDIPSPRIPETIPDSTIYSVNFCELVRNPKHYDGKIIRTKASHLQGIDTSSLSDSKCQGWIRPSCNVENAPCEKIWNRIGFGVTKVDIVGRFNADIVDRNPSQNGYRVNLIEILELKSAKPIKVHK